MKEKGLKQITAAVIALVLVVASLYPAFVHAEDEDTDLGKNYNVTVPKETKDYVIVSEKHPDKNADEIVEGDEKSVYVSNTNKISEASIAEENIEFNGSETSGNADDEGICVMSDAAEEIIDKYDLDWNYDMIHSDAGEGNKTSKDTVKIAIMDSGIDYITVPEIAGAVNLVETEQDNCDLFADMTGHGSSVASIIRNIDPEAELYDVRVLDSENKGTLSRVISGIYWCIDNGIDIINMSFGAVRESKILENALADANKAGILVVAAAGNDPQKDLDYPARYEDVISVASIDAKGNYSDNNANGEADILAPGECVFAEADLGLYQVLDGTSVAAPHVAGTAGLILEENPNYTNESIMELLMATSNRSVNKKDNEQDDNSTDETGIVDVKYALESADEFKNDPKQIETNHREVEKFKGADEITASWGHGQHQALITNMLIAKQLGASYLTNTQKEIMKRGAVYPDQAVLAKAVYHGRRHSNWFWSYKYLTALAANMKNGNGNSLALPASTPVSKSGKAKKSEHDMIEATIKSDFKMDKIRYNGNLVNWDYIDLDDNKNDILNGYQLTRENKAYFMYGVALHGLSDTFAHATYIDYDTAKSLKVKISDRKASRPGKYLPLVHNSFANGTNDDDDSASKETFIDRGGYVKIPLDSAFNQHGGAAHDPSIGSDRWRYDNKYAAKELIRHAREGKPGVIADFAPNDYREKGISKKRNYYLDSPAKKAKWVKESGNYDNMFAGVDLAYRYVHA